MHGGTCGEIPSLGEVARDTAAYAPAGPVASGIVKVSYWPGATSPAQSSASGATSPPGYADGDHPQLLDGDPPDVFQRLRALRVLDRLGDEDHRVHEQGRQDVEVLGAPLVQSREARQVGGQLGGDQPDLGADGVAQHAQPAVALAADEAPMLPSGCHTGDQNLDG